MSNNYNGSQNNQWSNVFGRRIEIHPSATRGILKHIEIDETDEASV